MCLVCLGSNADTLYVPNINSFLTSCQDVSFMLQVLGDLVLSNLIPSLASWADWPLILRPDKLDLFSGIVRPCKVFMIGHDWELIQGLGLEIGLSCVRPEFFFFFFTSHYPAAGQRPAVLGRNAMARSPLLARDHGLRLAIKEIHRKIHNQL